MVKHGEIKQRKSTIVLDVIFIEVAALEIRHCVHHFSKYHVLHFHLKTAVLRLPRPPMWPAMWCYRAAFYRRVWEHLGLALPVVLVFPLEAAFERGKKQLQCVCPKLTDETCLKDGSCAPKASFRVFSRQNGSGSGWEPFPSGPTMRTMSHQNCAMPRSGSWHLG